MGLLVSLSGNMHDASDIYQKTWLKVFMSPRFDAEQIKKGTLVFVSAKRLFIDQYRKNKSETQKRGALADLVFNPKSLQSPVSQDASTRSEEIELKKRFWAGYPDLDLAEEKKRRPLAPREIRIHFLGNRSCRKRSKKERGSSASTSRRS